MKALELSVHIPFCVKKCAYCDFLSAPAGEGERARYTETLIKEIRGYQGRYREYHITTVCIVGGGYAVPILDRRADRTDFSGFERKLCDRY